MVDIAQSFIPIMDVWLAVPFGAGLLFVGMGIGFSVVNYLKRGSQARIEKEIEDRLSRKLAEENRSQQIDFLEEKENWYQVRSEQENGLEEHLLQLNEQEREIAVKDREVIAQRENLNKERARLKAEERKTINREAEIRKSRTELDEVRDQYRQRLELVANMTTEEATEKLSEQLSDELKGRSAAMIRAARARAREESEKEARKIIAQAIQRCAVEEAEHFSTASVALPSEGIKSRIIGKDGRNVRAFEAATGVKVVVDDTPDTVLLSSFDPVKRETAAIAMQRLVKDGGFTPNRIDDVVATAKNEIEKDMVAAGKRALRDISATVYHSELPNTIGRLKYRSSYGQNQLQHCLEVAHLTGLMAGDIGVDVKLARRAGLLHDIGKTISRDLEGTHIDLGVELAERYGEDQVVKEVIAEHHEDHERLNPICFLVKAADAISSSRPGGRREDLEGYARRIIKLEEIANSFDGVKDVYAINAGREIRVMVRGDRIGDDDAEILAFDIAERVKSELTFPGEVKVMVVRETRAVRHTGRTRGKRGRNNQRKTSRRSVINQTVGNAN